MAEIPIHVLLEIVRKFRLEFDKAVRLGNTLILEEARKEINRDLAKYDIKTT